MTHEEILQSLFDDTLVGNAPAVIDAVRQGLDSELEPERMLYDALIPSLEEVGARFERGDYFVPEMLIAARAMQGALDILRPLLAESDTQAAAVRAAERIGLPLDERPVGGGGLESSLAELLVG